jgi:hypothetical protein
MRIGNRKREVDAARDALVGSGIAEWFAVENIVTGSDLDAHDARAERQRQDNQENYGEEENRGTETHARKNSTARSRWGLFSKGENS